jgi:SAM-dependent methyltransferase
MTGSPRSHPRFTLSDVFVRSPRRIYDWMYRRGAPWENGPRRELVELLECGRTSVERVGARAIDLGCGSGANSLLLARHGFDVTGVDLSPVAIGKAREAGTSDPSPPAFVVADLMALPSELRGPYDLLIDSGTIDDFPPSRRPEVARLVGDLARPGSVMVMWCFYAWSRDLPPISFTGPSRWGSPPVEPDELVDLFGREWEIDLLEGGTDEAHACFFMTRR